MQSLDRVVEPETKIESFFIISYPQCPTCEGRMKKCAKKINGSWGNKRTKICLICIKCGCQVELKPSQSPTFNY